MVPSKELCILVNIYVQEIKDRVANPSARPHNTKEDAGVRQVDA